MGSVFPILSTITWINTFGNDLTQHILSFLPSHHIKLVCKQWYALSHHNIKLRRKNAKQINIIWDGCESTAVIIGNTLINDEIKTILDKLDHFGPFRTVLDSRRWWNQNVEYKYEKGRLIEFVPPAPRFTTFLLFDDNHGIFGEHRKSYDIDNIFDLLVCQAKIIGMTNKTIILNNNPQPNSTCMFNYSICLYFENIIFDGLERNYTKFCQNGYFRISALHTIFVNCTFTARCGNTPIVCFNSEYSANISTPLIEVYGCIFQNTDRRKQNQFTAKTNRIKMKFSEYDQFPIFNDFSL